MRGESRGPGWPVGRATSTDLANGGGMTAHQSHSSVETQAARSSMSRQEILDFLRRRQEDFEDLDAALLAADYTEDAVIESPLAGRHVGPQAAEQALRLVFSAFLDMSMTFEEPLVDGDAAAQVITVEATHIGELLGVPPTGKRFRLTMAFFFEFRDRKIARERRVYDFTGLLVQIGVLKAKPA
jgi:predicted ester cyclase